MVGIGFDCRVQRSSLLSSDKSKEILLEESAMINDENRLNVGPLTGASEHSNYHLSPRRRREGLHSSEEMKKRDKDERDDESIQWEPGLSNLKDIDQMVTQNQSLTTLDTAIDWQQIQEIKYDDEDEDENGYNDDNDEMSLYSPRYILILHFLIFMSIFANIFLRYTPITQAEYVLPLSSRESTGKNLK